MKTTTFDTAAIGNADAPAPFGIAGAVSRIIAHVRQAAANRALYRQLSEMDDALLRDIGLDSDEIHRIRQGERVKAKAWQ